jgi:hypothetical protein
MPTQTDSLWTRLTGSFRRHPQLDGDQQPPTPVGDDGLLTQPAELPDAAAEMADRPGPLARWARRDQAIIQLQEGYEKVTRVIEDIQTHLVQQGERSERICGALEQIARAMVESPQIARQQAQTLDHIAAQIEAGNARSQQIAEIISELPKVTRSQTDTLSGIGRQLEISNEQSVIASQTMDRLGTGLKTLGETSQTQGLILRDMSVKAAEQSEQLSRLVASQGKRFMMLFVVTIVLALAAIGAAVVGLAMRP